MLLFSFVSTIFSQCTTEWLKQRFSFLVYMYIGFIHMAALDLHNKCSTTAATAKAKAKSTEEGWGRAKVDAESLGRAKNKSQANCCKNMWTCSKIKNSSNAHPRVQKARRAQLPEISLH